jgi:TusA-related sulfurtransferase
MATVVLDTLGMKCPQPVLKMAIKAKELQPGDIMEVLADCPSFPNDVEKWCKNQGKVLMVMSDEGGGKHKAQIQF